MDLTTLVFNHQFRSSSHTRRQISITPTSPSPPLDPLHPSLLVHDSNTISISHCSSRHSVSHGLQGISPATASFQIFSQNTNTDQLPPLTPGTPTSNVKSSSGFKRRSLNITQFLRRTGSKSQSASLNTFLKSPRSPLSPKNAHSPIGETEQFVCPCCNTLFIFPIDLPCSPCSTCGTIWDLPPSKKSGPSCLSHQPNQAEASFRITAEDVAKLNSLALSPEALVRFDSDPVAFLASKDAIDLQDQINSFNELASTLVSELFKSTYTLSNAFSSSDQVYQGRYESLSGLSIRLVRDFFHAVCSGPGGRDLLSTHVDRFLQRPGNQVWSVITNRELFNEPLIPIELSHWAWTVVLFECPILLPESRIPQQKRLVMMARLLGFISSLSNRLHYRLVSLYCHKSYDAELFSSKVELTNVFLSERIRHFLKVPGGFGNTSESPLPKYMSDWSLLVSSRVMSLLFGANFQTKKVPVTLFYNVSSDLIQPLDLIYDFETWETRRSPYALSGYPCILSISSKISLLTYEDKRQMGMEARQAFIEGILGRRAIAPVFQLRVRRSHLVEDSLRQIEAGRSELKKLLKIGFVNEEGVDGGGLKKEWFLLLIRRLVAPEYGMFIHDEETNQIWFNPASSEFEEFKLIGTVIGLAIYNCVTLDINLPLVCYKKLLKSPTSGLEDVQTFRPSVARGLKWILDYEGNDLEEVCGRNMVGDYESYGTIVEVPLIEGGADIPVSNKNRKEYVKLYSDFIVNKSVEKQFTAFAQGFNTVAAGNALSLFQPQEIELLVRGSEEALDFNQLQLTTVYDGYSRNDETIVEFWNYFKDLDVPGQRKALGFITGSDRIPAVGTSGLDFKISKLGDGTDGRLPVSHTCFNQLMLPDYKRRSLIAKKMNIAIGDSEGFGLN
ncbi:hypothetical protein BY996DRAFT_6429727 [Phakopsora pachyrhizi]|nr:hypothetical protein BY996DRAFT_6429727 [Phakopsora pachyrhizi]